MPTPWSTVPLLRLLIPFAGGIIMAWYCPGLHPDFWLSFLAVCLVPYLLLGMRSGRLAYSRRGLPAAFLLAGALAAGGAAASLHRAENKPDFYGHDLAKADHLIVRLDDVPRLRTNSWRVTAQVIRLVRGPLKKETSGQILLYFSADSLPGPLRYGDILLLENKAASVQAPRNPDEFDMCRHLALRNIHYSAFLSASDWAYTGYNAARTPWRQLLAWKARMGRFIDKHLPGPEEQAIARALLMGDESGISPELREAYAATGTLHILSVSGMHVGLIMWIFSRLLGFMDRGRWGRRGRFALLLGIIWAYAAFTGLSAPVVRAACMFSFAAAGMQIRRQASIYNSLAAAALFILLWEPFALFHTGFQLSFLALAGIVWLQPWIARPWKPRNRILKDAWSLITASLAAQLAVLPVSVYMFGQLPLYFLPANLLIVPWSSLVLLAGAPLLMLSAVLPPAAAQYADLIVIYGIKGLNAVTYFLHGLPGAVWSGLYLDMPQCLLFYAGLALVVTALMQKNKRSLAMGMLMLLALPVWRMGQHAWYLRHPEMRVFALNNGAALGILQGGKLHVLADTNFRADKRGQSYTLHRYAFRRGVSEDNIRFYPLERPLRLQNAGLDYRPPLGTIGGRRFAVAGTDKQWTVLNRDSSFRPEAVLLTSGQPDSLPSWPKVQWLGAGTVRYRRLEHWQQQALRRGLRFRNLEKDSSFVMPVFNHR